MTVWLHWRWGDSVDHTERRAPYVSLKVAKAQAEFDLARARDEGDFSTAPLRITSAEDGGKTLWTADLTDD